LLFIGVERILTLIAANIDPLTLPTRPSDNPMAISLLSDRHRHLWGGRKFKLPLLYQQLFLGGKPFLGVNCGSLRLAVCNCQTIVFGRELRSWSFCPCGWRKAEKVRGFVP
jgi:hypothetical protein